MTLQLRPATLDDLPALAEIEVEAALNDGFLRPMSLSELQHIWHRGLGPQKVPAIVVAERNGSSIGFVRLGGFQELNGPEVLTHRGFVLPEERGKGIGTSLTSGAERQLIRSAATSTPVLSAWHYSDEPGVAALLSERGYRVHRSMVEMVRPLNEPIPRLELPESVEIRPVEDWHLPQIWKAYVEAAADDLAPPADSQTAYEQWVSLPYWDHSLWTVAWYREQVVGVVLSSVPRQENQTTDRERAYLDFVGVVRSARRRGLATSLIQRNIARLIRCGLSEVALDVHCSNPNGAHNLYAALGFQSTRGIAIRRSLVSGLDKM